MEHESFEDESVAAIMNEYFICIKVDREERPDLDHVYMEAVQQIHGNGGWPLNCFVLPDGRPFWGGTYFRPEQWKQLLVNINNLFHDRLSDLEVQADEIAEGVKRQNYLIHDDSEGDITQLDFDAVSSLLHNSFDKQKGGMSGAPKFPMPVVLQFLLHFGITSDNSLSIGMCELTLQKMAAGGIFDQAGGGFARYSTDSDWKVPHFEKMLYDNAQLTGLYAVAYQLTGNSLYKDVVEQTIGFVLRELASPEGFFYSALDADSEGEEGLFYTWSAEEFSNALGHYASLAGEYYGIGEQGLWENDRNILVRPNTDHQFAQSHFLSEEELRSLTGFCRAQLLKFRSVRTRPALDDKMLVSWNALMISALADAGIALGKQEYLQSALDCAHFILKNMKLADAGLFHTWKAGKKNIRAFLDDFAFCCEAFLKLYSVTCDAQWLREANLLASYVVEHFYDSHSGFFWYSEKDEKHVFARKIEIYDGVTPSANSTMAHILNTLGVFLYKDNFLDIARQMIKAMTNRISNYPAAYSNWATLALSLTHEQLVVAVLGTEAVELIAILKKQIKPGVLLFGSEVSSNLPYFANRFVEGKTLIYICTSTYCLAPVESVQDAVELLGSRNSK